MGKSVPWLTYLITSFLLCTLMFCEMGCGETTTPVDGNIYEEDTTPPAISSVTPQSGNIIELVFSETVDGRTAKYRNNYEIYRSTGSSVNTSKSQNTPTAEGDTLHVDSIALLTDGKTVLLSVHPLMEDGVSYNIITKNIQDSQGNTMLVPDTTSFIGVDTPDVIAPEILDQSPEPGATGVGIGQSVGVTFTEPLEWNSVLDAFSWIGPGAVAVPFEMTDFGGGNVYVFIPESLLDYNTQYTVGFAANTAMDHYSNYLAETSWSFTTTHIVDNTFPRILSITPADSATNVPLDVTIKIDFSEPINPGSQRNDNIIVVPSFGDGVFEWMNSDKTVNFIPDNPLLANTTYLFSIAEAAWRDYAGNPLSEGYTVVFATGATITTGGFSGTISGDPNTAAEDPEGAWIIAYTVNVTTWVGGLEPYVGGYAVADHNGDYAIEYLEDGPYWPMVTLDSDADGVWSLYHGDAVGLYGVDLETAIVPIEMDSVIISGGNTVTDVDITLWDPSAIWGHISYDGTLYQENPQDYNCYAALYDTTGFDPETSTPVAMTENINVVWDSEFQISKLNSPLVDGTYYLGAYMDIDPSDGEGYNFLLDPANWHRVGGKPIAINIKNGSDFGGIIIGLVDPNGSEAPYMFGNITRPKSYKPILPRSINLRGLDAAILHTLSETKRQR